MKREIRVGDRVRLTGEFLRSTGQGTGPEGLSRWTVKAIDRVWAVTDQEADPRWFTPAEVEKDPSLAYRRILLSNLEVVG